MVNFRRIHSLFILLIIPLHLYLYVPKTPDDCPYQLRVFGLSEEEATVFSERPCAESSSSAQSHALVDSFKAQQPTS